MKLENPDIIDQDLPYLFIWIITKINYLLERQRINDSGITIKQEYRNLRENGFIGHTTRYVRIFRALFNKATRKRFLNPYSQWIGISK